MNSLARDVRFGFRQLWKSPAFSLAAVLTLALGIGANATVFTWFNAVVVNPLPGVPGSRDLVTVRWHTVTGEQRGLSWLDYLDFRKRSRTLEEFAVAEMAPLNVGEGSQPERLWSTLASANYFRMLGVKAALGRTFSEDEDEDPGGHPVLVLSHHLWRTKFGADANIVGRQILLNKRNFTVVGVMPESFEGSVMGLRFEMWVPVSMADVLSDGSFGLDKRGVSWFAWFQARPRAGVSLREVRADLDAISAQLAREFHQTDHYNRTEVLPISSDGGGSVLVPLALVLMAVVGVVLLIACANVANLLLARAVGRRREVAIRLALGIGRARLIRQLLIENGILAAVGLTAALVALPTTMGAIQAFAPASDLPVGLTVHASAGVYVFTFTMAAAATLLFGLVPALRASSPDVVDALKDDSAGSASPRKAWLRDWLVVAQVALSVVLLMSAGLFLKTLRRATAADPGFDARNVLLAGVDLLPNGYDVVRGTIAVRDMMAKLAELPGVAAVSTVRSIPLSLTGSSASRVEVEGYVAQKDEAPVVNTNVLGPDYFHTMHTLVVDGREFGPGDTAASQPVAVVNQTFASRYLPRGAVQRRVQVHGEWRVIVGVVRDSKFYSLDEKPRPWVYVPLGQFFASESHFLIRVMGDPGTYARAVESAIHQVDPALPVYGVRPLATAISASYFGQKIGGAFLGLFGGIAVVLASIGLYGVLAYTVSQRSREMGIRIALGASRASVLSLVLMQGARLAVLGLAIGVAIAIAVTRLMRSLLMDVSPTDITTLGSVVALLGCVAIIASFVPAHRATRIDPITAIRRE